MKSDFEIIKEIVSAYSNMEDYRDVTLKIIPNENILIEVDSDRIYFHHVCDPREALRHLNRVGFLKHVQFIGNFKEGCTQCDALFDDKTINFVKVLKLKYKTGKPNPFDDDFD